MTVRTGMAKSASLSSLRMRAAMHVKPWQAIDVFDLSQAVGVEVRFTNIASMEGVYLRQEPPVILIASERPAGRQRFTQDSCRITSKPYLIRLGKVCRPTES